MTVCVVHQDHEADEGWLVCRRAWGRLVGSLRQIPGLVAELHGLGYVQRDHRDPKVVYPPDHQRAGDWVPHFDPTAHALPAGPLNGSRNGAKVSGSPGRGAPIRVDVVDLLAPINHGALALRARGALGLDDDQDGYVSVATTLDYWVRRISRHYGDRAPRLGRERSLVLAQCEWLLVRLDDICQGFPELAKFAEEIREASSTLYGLAGYGASRPKVMEAVCPGCGFANLAQPYPEAYIECAMPDCGRVLTPDEYEEMVREMRHEIRAQDVLTVLNGLSPVDVEKLRFGVITAGYTKSPGQGRAAGKVIEHEEWFSPFDRGEVIVLLGASEAFGEGRRPAKSDVTCEEFKTLDEALARRSELLKTDSDAA